MQSAGTPVDQRGINQPLKLLSQAIAKAQADGQLWEDLDPDAEAAY
jgi:hypothetical protein